MSLLERLNEQQRAAVVHPGGPMLILAGAGSGKTRVITHRIAHLLASGVPASQVVAVTFTNKAAAEMQGRVTALLGAENASDRRVPWMGTFHAFGLRLLRWEVRRTDLLPGFVVHDSDDAKALVKTLMRERSLDEKTFPPARVASRISRLKGECIGPDTFVARRADLLGEVVEQVYGDYQERLLRANACDFDDLLLRPVQLLEKDDEARASWQERVRHLLVDEYQDTNTIQYRLIRLLSGRHGNVCAVGDEDQSIYRFRGAEIRNILRFEEDFPGTAVFRIEQNYRSTGNILAAADGVVSRNALRKGKTLWTANPAGELVTIHRSGTDLAEAEWAADEARRRGDHCGWSEVAILYRTNAQSRLFEEALARRRIPHVVIGGLRFYERREVKDILCYLRLVVNPHDDVALERVINVPARGIGRGAQDALRALARQGGASLWRALVEGQASGAFSGRLEKATEDFIALVEGLRSAAHELPPGELVRLVLERTRYVEELEKEGPEAARDRRANLEELASAAAEHAARDEESGVSGFLSQVALAADTDALGQEDRVQLMTLHAAKGLEFDTVLLVGLEEGLFPHASSIDEPADLEEERRLCHVGMTRARTHLLLSFTDRRRVFGIERVQVPSRFLAEIPAANVRLTGLGAGVASGASTGQPAPTARVREESRDALSSFFGDASIPYEDISQDEDEDVAMKKGDQVRHAKWGVGTVLSLEGQGDDAKLTVYFSSRGRVRLVQRFANLQRVR